MRNEPVCGLIMFTSVIFVSALQVHRPPLLMPGLGACAGVHTSIHSSLGTMVTNNGTLPRGFVKHQSSPFEALKGKDKRTYKLTYLYPRIFCMWLYYYPQDQKAKFPSSGNFFYRKSTIVQQ